MENLFNFLPDEILIYIFAKCNSITLKQIKQVCTRFYTIFWDKKFTSLRFEKKVLILQSNFNKISPFKCAKWCIYQNNTFIFEKLLCFQNDINRIVIKCLYKPKFLEIIFKNIKLCNLPSNIFTDFYYSKNQIELLKKYHLEYCKFCK